MRNVRTWAIPVLAATAAAVTVPALPASAAGAGPTHELRLTLRPAAGSLLPSAGEIASVTSALEARGLHVDGHQGLELAVHGSARALAASFRATATGLTASGLGAAATNVVDGYDPSADPVRWQPHYLTGVQLVSAYQVPDGPTGKVAPPTIGSSTPIVATVQLSGWNSGDLTTFARTVFTDPAYDPVASGQYSAVPVDQADPGTPDGNQGEFEVALDQESILSAAPTLRQRAYFTQNSGQGLIDAYSKVLADVMGGAPIVGLSTSWGGCELLGGQSALANAMSGTLTQLEAAGVTIFAASGDDGSDDCGDGRAAVDYPASSPSVIGVGGTHHGNGGNTPAPDTAWEDPTSSPPSGSGGGQSILFGRPAWQGSVSTGTHRLVPDISLDADPQTGIAAVVDGGNYLVGGTSLAAPASAAMLADVVSAHGSMCGLGDIHAALYAHPSDFTDVVASELGGTGSAIQPTAVGYDQSTGLGTPNFTALGNDIYAAGAVVCATPRAAASSPTAATTPTETSSPGNPTVQVTQWARGSKGGTAELSWNATDIAPLSSFTVGVFRADGSLAVTATVGSSIRSLLITAPGGTAYTVTLTALDSTGVTASTRSRALLMPLDDRNSKLSIGWRSVRKPGSLGATVSSSSKPGATATATLDGSRLGVLIATGPAGGSFQLLVDGRVVKVVNTKGASRSQVAVTVPTRSGSHRVTVRILKAAHGTTGAVALDAFIGS